MSLALCACLAKGNSMLTNSTMYVVYLPDYYILKTPFSTLRKLTQA